jgi:hypothetical protein
LIQNTNLDVNYRFHNELSPVEISINKLDLEKTQNLVSLKASLKNSLSILKVKFLELRNGRYNKRKSLEMLHYLLSQEADLNQALFRQYISAFEKLIEKLTHVTTRRLYPNAPTGNYLATVIKILSNVNGIDVNLELIGTKSIDFLDILTNSDSFNPESCGAIYALEYAILDNHKEREHFFRSKGINTVDIQHCST